MFIIKDGDKELAEKKRKQTKLFECKTCGCIFEADNGEYLITDCRFDVMYYAKCPCCGYNANETKEKQL